MLTENGVDGVSLCHLTNGDLNLMLPGKVGVARKLTVFIDRLNSDNVLSREPVSNVNQPIASTHTSTEAAVSAIQHPHAAIASKEFHYLCTAQEFRKS